MASFSNKISVIMAYWCYSHKIFSLQPYITVKPSLCGRQLSPGSSHMGDFHTVGDPRGVPGIMEAHQFSKGLEIIIIGIL